MKATRALLPCTALLLACMASSAPAGESWYKAQSWYETDPDEWRATHQSIYELENLIAFLEADPQTDDGYRAPIIRRARADIERLRGTLPPAQWRWTNPCCYSRPPIHIR